MPRVAFPWVQTWMGPKVKSAFPGLSKENEALM